jgi:hypothetical protein
MYIFKLISIWLTFGFLCSYLAKNKNRKPVFWFYMGVFFGLIAVVVILFLKKDKKIIHEIKDIKVKIDNSIFKINPLDDKNFWYYLDKDNKQIGPLSLKAIEDNFLNKKINPFTYVWNDTLDEWKKLNELEILKTTN